MRLLFCTLFSSLSLIAASDVVWEYSETRARLALDLAAAAYADDPLACVDKAFPNKHFRFVGREEKACDTHANACAGFAAVSNAYKTIVISFRGTYGIKQLKLEAVNSLKPSLDWHGYGLVDRYFSDAINRTWPTLLPILSQNSSMNYDVYFTGHSLGGALATLAAMKTYSLKLRSSDKIHLFTFGEPRVGNLVFANNVDRIIMDSWRIVNKADIIPHLPPCKDDGKGCSKTNLARAHHHGTEVWYNNGMKAGANHKLCTSDDEDPDCSDKLGSYHINDHYYYFDHMVSEYGRAGCVDTTYYKDSSSLLSYGAMLVISILVLL